MYDRIILSCSRHELKNVVRVLCPNCTRTWAQWDGHTYRCPECKRDIGRYVYDRIHFSFPNVDWKDVIIEPDYEDAMTWVKCSPETSKKVTEGLKIVKSFHAGYLPSPKKELPFRKITPVKGMSPSWTGVELDDGEDLQMTSEDEARCRFHASFLTGDA